MPESRPETIAAVVVTYNRKQWLGECLDSLLRQSRPLDALYVVDNHSTDGTCDSLLAGELIGPIPETGGEPAEVQRSVVPPPFPERRVDVHYVRMPENTGGAGGFH